MMLTVEPVVLYGRYVRLEPAAKHHAESLASHATPETFQHFVTGQPPTYDRDGLEDYISSLANRPDLQSFAVVLQATDEAIGMSSYLDIRAAHRGLEIGMTWYGAPYRGTVVNPESKLLLLGHAFETLNCVRVQLKTDARNKVSQAAIRKLGAKFEGVLRQHGVMPDGYIRDTVMYSILPEEWPSVKANLEERVAALGSVAPLP